MASASISTAGATDILTVRTALTKSSAMSTAQKMSSNALIPPTAFTKSGDVTGNVIAATALTRSGAVLAAKESSLAALLLQLENNVSLPSGSVTAKKTARTAVTRTRIFANTGSASQTGSLVQITNASSGALSVTLCPIVQMAQMSLLMLACSPEPVLILSRGSDVGT